MKLRRVISFITILCVLLTMTLTVYAADANTVSDKAKTLNRLNILMGDGIDFNLDGQLRRSEAATFIVRLMGKEDEVLANKAKWSVTDYKDVENGAWYAPYIGYCSQLGIISGFPDGSYKPNDYISEKAFLKLVLVVLGYEYNTHFTWNNVFSKAYDVGLIKDYTYQSKVEDDYNYKRKSVVEVLYNSLRRPNRSTKMTLIDSLIEQGIVDKKIAAEEGLIKDEIITEISSISVIDTNTIKIKFNEEIEKLDVKDIIISEASSSSTKLTVKIKSQSADELTLTTSDQVPDKEYVITILNVTDKEGIKNDINGSFVGYKSVEVNSDFFRIKKVEAISKNVINVYFTQPINMNAEIPLYYEIFQGDTSYVKGSFNALSVKTLAPYDNAVSIFLKEKSMLDGANYKLKINGALTSVYSARLNNGSDDSMSFIGNGSPNEDFYVISVIPINKNFISVQFNKDIDLSSSQVNTNYTLKDSRDIPIFITSAVATKEGSMKNKEVILRTGLALDSTNSYELTINNVYDSFTQIKIAENSKYPIQGVSTEVDDLHLVNVLAEDKGTISVFFNKPVSASVATNIGNYLITGVTSPGISLNPSKVYFDSSINPYMVKLFLSSDIITGSDSFKLQVSNMADYLGITYTSIAPYTFNGSSTENISPFFVEAKIIANDTIKVITSKEISSGGSNTIANNYTLEYKDGDNTVAKNPSSVSYLNANTLLMKFDSLDFSRAYTLKINIGITDYNGVTRMPTSGLNSIGVALGQ